MDQEKYGCLSFEIEHRTDGELILEDFPRIGERQRVLKSCLSTKTRSYFDRSQMSFRCVASYSVITSLMCSGEARKNRLLYLACNQGGCSS